MLRAAIAIGAGAHVAGVGARGSCAADAAESVPLVPPQNSPGIGQDRSFIARQQRPDPPQVGELRGLGQAEHLERSLVRREVEGENGAVGAQAKQNRLGREGGDLLRSEQHRPRLALQHKVVTAPAGDKPGRRIAQARGDPVVVLPGSSPAAA
jgi:hypothetical protein